MRNLSGSSLILEAAPRMNSPSSLSQEESLQIGKAELRSLRLSVWVAVAPHHVHGFRLSDEAAFAASQNGHLGELIAVNPAMLVLPA